MVVLVFYSSSLVTNCSSVVPGARNGFMPVQAKWAHFPDAIITNHVRTVLVPGHIPTMSKYVPAAASNTAGDLHWICRT